MSSAALTSMNPLRPVRRWIHTFRKVRHSPLPQPLKRELVHAAHRLDRRLPKQAVQLMGYSVTFLGEQSLRYLFDEVFVGSCYFFRSDTDMPAIVDCGSNIGLSVLFFKKLYPRARITAFEPDPATFYVLTKNIADNGLADVIAHRVALGDRNGMTNFYRDTDDGSSSLTMSTNPERHTGRTIQVPVRRLSEYITSTVDLLKIDVEGAEHAVIEDLVATDTIRHVRTMHLEYHHHIGSEPDRLSTMLRRLEDAGFGYQLKSEPPQWATERTFQDVSLYCYRQRLS
jgi:FkbM family methyltransferase